MGEITTLLFRQIETFQLVRIDKGTYIVKKLLITLTALFGLLGSMSAFAAVELKPSDLKRINKEVTSMASYMSLSDSEAQIIRELKKNLTLKNRTAIAEHGRGTPEFKKARRKIMKSYQAELFQVVTKQEFREWQQTKKKRS